MGDEKWPLIEHVVKTLHKKEYPTISPLNPANSAANKTVLITGAHSGVGYAIARAFALAGASTVIIVARRADLLRTAAEQLRAEIPSTTFESHVLDIANEDNITSVFSAVRQRLPPGRDVDVLVLNAANIVMGDPALSYSSATMRSVLDANLIGNVALVRTFLAPPAAAAAAADKVVIDVSAVSAYRRYPGQALYSTGKLAFAHYMQHVAADYAGGSGVRVHSFHPGGVLTESTRADMGEDSYDWDDPSLPGGVALWLASPAAAFLHGRWIMSCWDVDELVALKDKVEKDQDFLRTGVWTRAKV